MTKTFHIQLMSLITKNKKSGFALLYAILLTSVVLVVGVALINIITRQLILTSLNRNSQIAYYNATSVRHCLDFYDEKEYFIEETYGPDGDSIKTINQAGDIEYFLNWKPEKSAVPLQKTLFSDLDDKEKSIYELLSAESEMTIDAICRKLDLPVFKLSSILLQMEFKGLIKCYPGNIYRTV